jgi:hypothetical protein
MIDWILCAIGIAIYFINRYANRTVKTTGFSVKFWIKDNFPELSTTILLNIALMIIIHQPGSEASFDKLFESLPFSLHLAAMPLLSFLIGLGLSAVFYRLFKEKAK